MSTEREPPNAPPFSVEEITAAVRLNYDEPQSLRLSPNDRCSFYGLRPELFHRLHVRDKLIEGDLSPLLPARRFVVLKVSFIPVQRREDVASSASQGFHRDDGRDRNVVEHCGAITGKQHGGPAEPLHRDDFQETADIGKRLTPCRGDVDAEDAARSHVQFAIRNSTPGLGHVPLLEVLRFCQRLPDEMLGSVDEPFENQIKLRIDREVLAHDLDSVSLSCLTYLSNRSNRASHN